MREKRLQFEELMKEKFPDKYLQMARANKQHFHRLKANNYQITGNEDDDDMSYLMVRDRSREEKVNQNGNNGDNDNNSDNKKNQVSSRIKLIEFILAIAEIFSYLSRRRILINSINQVNLY